jgi:23S rRNA (uracil1939-C5)-methyltransferase
LAARRPGSPLSAAEPEEAWVARLGAEGDGIAERADGTRLYLPFVLPGERVRARPSMRRGDGFAATAEILEASAERVAPPCPHFGACGGCALQHWQDAPYLAWKSGLLTAALRRAGYAVAVAPIIATPPRARRRMALAARREGGAVRLGLHAAHDTMLVDLSDCAVLDPRLARLIAPLRDLLGAVAALRRAGAVVANLLDSGPDLLLRTDAELTAPDRVRLAEFARDHAVPRVSWARGEAPAETAAQLAPIAIRFGGIAVTPPPGAFLQASALGEAAIVAAVLAGLPERLPPRARVAELHAGCGTLTFPLAGRARVTAFEGDAAAAQALAEAAHRGGLAGRVEALRRDLARQPLRPAELAPFAAVVLDPPHAGAAAQVAQIAASPIARVIYVGCNPATLARDAAMLRAAGFGVVSALPIDQFRWSARLESVVTFARADPA